MEQRSAEWFAARLGKVTASKIADVIAKTKTGESAYRKKYKMQLVTERLTGKKEDVFINQAMQNGIDREEAARDIYIKLTGNQVTETGLVDHPNIAMSGASPDGIITTTKGIAILEIKCPTDATHTYNLLSKAIPSQYIPQVQWQIACCDAEYADFMSYNPNFEPSLQVMLTRVERDNDYIAMLETQVTAFLTEVDDIINQVKERING